MVGRALLVFGLRGGDWKDRARSGRRSGGRELSRVRFSLGFDYILFFFIFFSVAPVTL